MNGQVRTANALNMVTLVIPCWNESARLDVGAFLAALSANPSPTFVFVDDGSTDTTAETLAFLRNQSPAIEAIFLPKNGGKAEAVRAGVNWALDHTPCEAVGFWDADLATPLSEVPRFIGELAANPSRELVIGARWPHLGAEISRSGFRSFTGAVMKRLIRLAVGVPVYDTQCGAKLFRRETARKLFARPFLSSWLFDVELLIRFGAARLRRSGVELPLANWVDVPGSKMKALDLPRVLLDLLRIRLTNRALNRTKLALARLPQGMVKYGHAYPDCGR